MSLGHPIWFQEDLCPNYKTKPQSGPVFRDWQVLLRSSVAEQWGYWRSAVSCIDRTAGGVFAALQMSLWSWHVGLFLCLSQSCQKLLRVVTAFFKIYTFLLLCNYRLVVTTWITLTKKLSNGRRSLLHSVSWLGSVCYSQWVVRVHNVWPST